MKQVLRKGLRDIVVEEVPDPAIRPHHVLVRPLYSLIASLRDVMVPSLTIID